METSMPRALPMKVVAPTASRASTNVSSAQIHQG